MIFVIESRNQWLEMVRVLLIERNIVSIKIDSSTIDRHCAVRNLMDNISMHSEPIMSYEIYEIRFDGVSHYCSEGIYQMIDNRCIML